MVLLSWCVRLFSDWWYTLAHFFFFFLCSHPNFDQIIYSFSFLVVPLYWTHYDFNDFKVRLHLAHTKKHTNGTISTKCLTNNPLTGIHYRIAIGIATVETCLFQLNNRILLGFYSFFVPVRCIMYQQYWNNVETEANWMDSFFEIVHLFTYRSAIVVVNYSPLVYAFNSFVCYCFVVFFFFIFNQFLFLSHGNHYLFEFVSFTATI